MYLSYTMLETMVAKELGRELLMRKFRNLDQILLRERQKVTKCLYMRSKRGYTVP